MKAEKVLLEPAEAIHNWFGLSYAAYMVLPRSVLQSMPQDWQKEFVLLVDKIPEVLNVVDMPKYKVSALGDNGKFVICPFRDYERGRRKIQFK